MTENHEDDPLQLQRYPFFFHFEKEIKYTLSENAIELISQIKITALQLRGQDNSVRWADHQGN